MKFRVYLFFCLLLFSHSLFSNENVTFNIGDVLTFDVESAGKGIWIKEVVPASTTSYSNNTHVFGLIGESA